MTVKDLFSAQAIEYVKYRPTYPDELFDYLKSITQNHDAVWDCATGNGQAAVKLSEIFRTVFATDMSQKQIENGMPRENIRYSVGTAQASGLGSSSVDLVTVAQAFHWIFGDDFYKEVRRVAKPNAKLAVWSYALAFITPEIDELVDSLYNGTLGSYWEPGRKFVEDEYRTISVSFTECKAPHFEMNVEWSADQFIGYLSTWSALQSYIKKNGTNPLTKMTEEFKRCWGENQKRQVKWPLTLRVFQIS